MAKTSLTVNIEINGLKETIRALNKLPKDAQNELRAAALDLSKELAAAARSSGQAEGSQAALVASTVKAMRDRVPVVQAGGTKRLGRNKKPAYKLLFGSEFGSNEYKQFGKRHIGKGSYWFYKTIDDKKADIAARWQKAADEVINKFGRGG